MEFFEEVRRDPNRIHFEIRSEDRPFTPVKNIDPKVRKLVEKIRADHPIHGWGAERVRAHASIAHGTEIPLDVVLTILYPK